MKRLIPFLVTILSFFAIEKTSAQTYSAWGVTDNGAMYDTIFNYNDTLYFNFTGLPAGAHGTAHLVVYYEGDFGDFGEFVTAFIPTQISVGDAGPYPSGNDCDPEDSTSLGFDAAQIDPWGGSVVIKALGSPNVDPGNCQTLRVRVRLEYDYCAFGTPVELADFTIPNDQVCPTAGPQTLTGTPAGGTFTGTGISGSSFNPVGLTGGDYDITYTATDAIGCVSSKTETIRVLRTPGDVNQLICKGEAPTLTPGGPAYVFSPMPNLAMIFDTLPSYTFLPVTQSPTTYYYAPYDLEDYYMIDTITNDNAVIVDINNTAGDDRGGIAITDSTLYMVGDDATVRFDLDLLTAAVTLPKRDGIFSDLRERKIYSLYNTDLETMPDYDNTSDFTCNAIIALDADLNPTTNIMPLSQTLMLGSNNSNSAMLAGYGKLVIYNGNDNHAYAIDLDFGDVTDLGSFNFSVYGSENWADWGVAGYDGTDYTAYYRDYNFDQIVAHNLTTNTITVASQFSDVSDMASFITHPTNQRLYFHYEGGGQFGGTDETLGYLDMTDSTAAIAGGGIGCPSQIVYTFNSVDLGNDTTVCADNGQLFVLEAGLGYQSYTWNGVNNNWNIYPVQNSGQYILEVVDAINCTLVDTINVSVVTVDCSTGLDELQAGKMTAYPVPNKGSFELSFSKNLTNAHISLVNTQGVTCFTTAMSGTQTAATINATGLATGVYFVQLTSDEGTTQPITVIIE